MSAGLDEAEPNSEEQAPPLSSSAVCAVARGRLAAPRTQARYGLHIINHSVDLISTKVDTDSVTSAELKRWLAAQGCTFSTQGKGGHITVHFGDKRSTLPMHGSGKELGAGLVAAIKRDLGLR
jgi:mRNA interferase HicA